MAKRKNRCAGKQYRPGHPENNGERGSSRIGPVQDKDYLLGNREKKCPVSCPLVPVYRPLDPDTCRITDYKHLQRKDKEDQAEYEEEDIPAHENYVCGSDIKPAELITVAFFQSNYPDRPDKIRLISHHLSNDKVHISYPMESPVLSVDIPAIIWKYRVHLFIFFLVLFIGLTLAHPAILLNDEFITANQVRQFHAGHQIIVNEGKYGLGENGTMSGYFAYHGDILGYSLFLPVLSMPAYRAIDIFGEQIAYLVLVIWAITALLLLLFINRFFKKFSYIGRWQWTPVMAGVIFLLFFVSLYYYSAFTVDDFNSYPDILAIVLTNMFLLALSAMLIYEICRTIFDDPAFSFFGGVVCVISSSYFFWSTYCKDHILVLACFVPIVLCLVRFIKTDEYWYLPMAFIGCGLLAWARPEVALWMALLVLCICGYTLLRFRSQARSGYSSLSVVLSPLFTFIGALPFFLNNYITTENIFLPTQSLYLYEGNVTTSMNASQSLLPVAGVKSVSSVIAMFLPAVPRSPLETISDLAGVFFAPATGNVGVFTLVPVFFVMIVVGGILLIFKKLYFTPEEKKLVILLLLVSGAVFFAYASQIHSLNTDGGITPDVRYLSLLYFPLTIIGLFIVRKINILPVNPDDSIRELCWIGIIGVPLSISLLYFAHLMNPVNFSKGIIPLGKFFSLYVIALILLTIVILVYALYRNRGKKIAAYLILLLYAVPFFWQINATFFYYTFSGYAGHIFWIPIMRVGWAVIVHFILLY
jgi:hypothetical protein